MSTSIDRSEFPSAFHTALRKGVDSPASAVTWNLLYLMPSEVKKAFYDHVCAQLDQDTFTAATLRAAVLSWRDAADIEIQREYNHEVLALSCAFEMHDHEDWTSIASTLRHYGIAPAADYDVDSKSHWIDGGGFKVEVLFRDVDGVQLGQAGIALKSATGEPLNRWYGNGPDGVRLKGDTVEDIVGIIETARTAARQARLDRLEERARPEIVEQLRGIHLRPDLDPSNPADARVIELAGETPEVVMRWPSRQEGKDCVVYVCATPAPDAEFGQQFWRTTVALDDLSDAKKSKSLLQRWLDGEHRHNLDELSYEIATDDDLIRGIIVAKRTDGGLQIEGSIKKVGAREEVLSAFGLGYEAVSPRSAIQTSKA